MALKRIRLVLSLPLYDKFNLAALWFYRLKGMLLYRWVFKSFGSNSAIYSPMLIGRPRFIHIGDRVTIRNGVRLEAVISKPGREPLLRIGNNVLIEQRVHIVCHSRVIIGSNVSIAGHCAIVDVTHPLTNRNPSVNAGSHIIDDDSFVEIGDGVFIGFGAVILPGVSIGECAVIGANSVVTHDIPGYCTAAGAPAVVLRTDLRAEGVPAAVSSERK